MTECSGRLLAQVDVSLSINTIKPKNEWMCEIVVKLRSFPRAD